MADKSRSKNFPAFGLEEGIAKARQLYDRDGKSAVDTSVAVQAWKYTGLNGASLRALAAVRQYGLLDSPGTKVVKISQTALTIILEPENSAERAAAIRAAAYTPAMFQALREQYPDSLPSDAAVVSWLVRNHNFSEKGAKSLIASYRETVALVERLPNADIDPEGGDPGETQPKGVRRAAAGTPEAPEHPGANRKPAPDQQGVAMQFEWPLSGNASATLSVTKALDLEDIETLSAYFEIAKKALAKAAKAHEPEPPSPRSD